MADDSDDDLQAKAQKYGWSPSEVAYYKSLRGDIPQAQPSPDSGSGTPPAGTITPAQVDPTAAAGVAQGMQNQMWAGGSAGGPASMAQGGTVRPHYSSNHHAHTTNAQVPGLEPAQQQMEMKKNALHKLKEHDRHRVRKPEPKKPKK